jgi:hypothetical protein
MSRDYLFIVYMSGSGPTMKLNGSNLRPLRSRLAEHVENNPTGSQPERTMPRPITLIGPKTLWAKPVALNSQSPVSLAAEAL